MPIVFFGWYCKNAAIGSLSCKDLLPLVLCFGTHHRRQPKSTIGTNTPTETILVEFVGKFWIPESNRILSACRNSAPRPISNPRRSRRWCSPPKRRRNPPGDSRTPLWQNPPIQVSVVLYKLETTNWQCESLREHTSLGGSGLARERLAVVSFRGSGTGPWQTPKVANLRHHLPATACDRSSHSTRLQTIPPFAGEKASVPCP
mmetsp:Transcript_16807/g.34649  ORF Transcript_16807/g.34649 Transcript_16807/m.34649 type:complete len:203 (-) Transcript_16807:374-982(-)